jgi:hypothetical protein
MRDPIGLGESFRHGVDLPDLIFVVWFRYKNNRRNNASMIDQRWVVVGKSVAYAAALLLWIKLFFLQPLAEEAAAMVGYFRFTCVLVASC